MYGAPQQSMYGGVPPLDYYGAQQKGLAAAQQGMPTNDPLDPNNQQQQQGQGPPPLQRPSVNPWPYPVQPNNWQPFQNSPGQQAKPQQQQKGGNSMAGVGYNMLFPGAQNNMFGGLSPNFFSNMMKQNANAQTPSWLWGGSGQ